MRRLTLAVLLTSAAAPVLASGLGVGGPGGGGGSSVVADTITINAIGPKNINTGFNISGNITGSAVATGVDYQRDCTGTWTALSAPTITATSWSSTALDVQFSTATNHTVCVRQQPSVLLTAASNSFNVSASGETIVATAPSGTLNTNAAYTQQGSYTGGPPTALDWSYDGTGCGSAATSPTISGGTYSFANTLPSTAGTHTITVCDHGAHAIFGTSTNFTVTSTAVTWDPTGTTMVLSNGNLTASNPPGGTWKAVRNTTPHSSGKYYFEFTAVAVPSGGGGYMFGIGNSSASLTTYVGSDINGYGFQCDVGTSTAFTYYNGKSGSDGGPVANNLWQYCRTGDVMAVAIDLTANNIWIKNLTLNNGWNSGVGGGTGDPAAGSNPIAIGSVTGNRYVAFSGLYNGTNSTTMTVNFGPSYTGTPPSGFGNW